LSNYWLNLLLFGSIGASLAYFTARRIKVMALVDVVWTAGLGFAAAAYMTTLQEISLRSYIVLAVLLIWSTRLSIYLLKHRVFAGTEDPRYAYLTAHWGQHAMRNYYPLFLAQVLLIALFMVPVSIAMQASYSSWSITDWIGLAVAVSALVGEFMADRQLATFRAAPENRGRVCQVGLWRYSRHPNYFFEWLHWWAYVAFSLNSNIWPLALIGPLCMYIFLRYITGVPYAERSSLRSRGEAYQHYQLTTNTFFPWKPHPSPQH
jgi:steroid 5-alpha reductase family enzyme